MHRCEATNKDTDKHGTGKHGYKDKAPSITGTAILAAACDAWQEELATCVESQGGTLLTAATDTFDQLNQYGTRAGTGFFGDYSDGDVTLGSNTTLTRDMYYRDLDLAGYTIYCAGFRVFARHITGTGYITHVGDPGDDYSTGWQGGAASVDGSISGSSAGGNGGNGGVGANGGNVVDSLGGAGGAGGVGISAGGTGGTSTAIPANEGTVRDAMAARNTQSVGIGGSTFVRGGAGGGGGGDNGGGGGAGGGVVMVAAVTIGSGVAIQAYGGDGGDADVGGAAHGGGGGGGGGVAFVLCRHIHATALANINVSGGAGGTGIDGGGNGVAGSAGYSAVFYV